MAVKSEISLAAIGDGEVVKIVGHPLLSGTVIILQPYAILEVNTTSCTILSGIEEGAYGDCKANNNSVLYESRNEYPYYSDIDTVCKYSKHYLFLCVPNQNYVHYYLLPDLASGKYLGQINTSGHETGRRFETYLQTPMSLVVHTESGFDSSVWVKVYHYEVLNEENIYYETTCDVGASPEMCVRRTLNNMNKPSACFNSVHNTMVVMNSPDNTYEISGDTFTATVRNMCGLYCTFLKSRFYYVCRKGLIKTSNLQINMIDGTMGTDRVGIIDSDGQYMEQAFELLEPFTSNSMITYDRNKSSVLEISDEFCSRPTYAIRQYRMKLHKNEGDCGTTPLTRLGTANINSCWYACLWRSNCNSFTFNEITNSCDLNKCYRLTSQLHGSHLKCYIFD